MIGFLNPLALAFALLAGGVVLMYLLKLKRKREDFSSTLLWVKSTQDLTANAPFQKLRQNLLMYLQILLLVLLALALARPTMWLTRRGGIARIVLIDNSASMNATDATGHASRLAAAKSEAEKLIDNMTAGDRMMLVSFGAAARVVQPLTPEKSLLRGALDLVQPSDAPARIQEALLLAQGVRKLEQNAQITIISDGGIGYLGNLLHEDDPVDFIRIGEGDNNRGIVAFDMRESFENTGEAQVFAEVENFSADPADVILRCLVDGELLQAKEARIDGKGKQGFVFSGLRSGEHSMMTLELVGEDALAADNAVSGILDIDTSLEILVVTNGNFFLERVLTLVPGAKVSKIAPADYLPTGQADIVVFDQYAPPALTSGRYLFMNSLPPLEGFALGETPLKDQLVLDWSRVHPVTRYTDFGQLFIGESLAVTAPDWTVTLAEGAEGPMIYAGDHQGVRLIGIAFDLYSSDWPLQISFPIFISNAIRWLAGAGEGSLEGKHAVGETIKIETASPVTIEGPSGESWTIEPNIEGAAYFNQTHRVGLYELEIDRHSDEEAGERQHGHEHQRFAVNLLSREESDIVPKGELIAGEQRIVAASTGLENREIWNWLALAGIVVLALEWHLYCRRSWL